MRTVFRIWCWVVIELAAVCVTPALAAGQRIKLNGGLEAEIVTIGRNRSHNEVTIALNISNPGQDIAYLVLSLDPPVAAISNTGGSYILLRVSGITQCGSSPIAACTGTGPYNPGAALPLQSWTEIDPGTNITVNFDLTGMPDTGPLVSFSATTAYRTVHSEMQGETLSDSQKRQSIRVMTLSFPPTAVQDTP